MTTCEHGATDSCLLCLPITPYAGTSGWAGSSTSRERAATQDRNGTTAARQLATLSFLRQARENGLTWQELAALIETHHGGASGVLSVLHKDGRIARLSETRNRCKIYVDPQYVNGRRTEEHGRKKSHPCPNCGWDEAYDSPDAGESSSGERISA